MKKVWVLCQPGQNSLWSGKRHESYAAAKDEADEFIRTGKGKSISILGLESTIQVKLDLEEIKPT